MSAPYRWDVLDGKLNDNPLLIGLGPSPMLLKSALWHENDSAGMPTSKAGHTRDKHFLQRWVLIRFRAKKEEISLPQGTTNPPECLHPKPVIRGVNTFFSDGC
jgi:hypothetical protein